MELSSGRCKILLYSELTTLATWLHSALCKCVHQICACGNFLSRVVLPQLYTETTVHKDRTFIFCTQIENPIALFVFAFDTRGQCSVLPSISVVQRCSCNNLFHSSWVSSRFYLFSLVLAFVHECVLHNYNAHIVLNMQYTMFLSYKASIELEHDATLVLPVHLVY